MPQPHKGDRVAFTVRIPREPHDKIVALAKDVGMNRQDFIEKVLVAYANAPSAPGEAVRQEELPLAKTA